MFVLLSFPTVLVQTFSTHTASLPSLRSREGPISPFLLDLESTVDDKQQMTILRFLLILFSSDYEILVD